jgi:hypothetical protein
MNFHTRIPSFSSKSVVWCMTVLYDLEQVTRGRTETWFGNGVIIAFSDESHSFQ